MSTANKKIRITEVGPRDGLQNEKKIVPIQDRASWILELAKTGVDEIEFGAFVSPKWVPQMQGSAEVYKLIKSLEGKIELTALVPNEKGLEQALQVGCKKIALFTATSETFSQKNTNCSVAESLERIQALNKTAQGEGLKVRAYISTAFVCPYEGVMKPNATSDLVKQFLDWGILDISIGDTVGQATPLMVEELLKTLQNILTNPALDLAMHFHDTTQQALNNVKTSLEWGVRHFDASAGGLGGCPYAPGASGNVATESLMQFLFDLGYKPYQNPAWDIEYLQSVTHILKAKI